MSADNKDQFVMDLSNRPRRGRDAFFVSDANRLALAAIEDWRKWPQGMMALVGPEGSGKTHMVRLWADETKAEIVTAMDLARLDPVALSKNGAVAVENVDRLSMAADPTAAEVGLFHLYNHLRGENGKLLVTGREAPSRWRIVTPDLVSRLQSMPVSKLEAPDDALFHALIVKLFHDRGIEVNVNVPAFLAMRLERSFAEAERAVAMIDRLALREHKRVSRDLAARALGFRES